MNIQFSLGRLLQLLVVVAVPCAIFAQWKWPLALLAMLGLNGFASVWFWLTKRPQVGGMAALTAILIFAALLFTDWDIDSPRPPVVRVAWPWLTAACVSQLVTVLMWMVSVRPAIRGRPAQADTVHITPPETPRR